MRLGILTGIAFSLLAAGIATAQNEPNEAPIPPSPTRPLPAPGSQSRSMNVEAMPAWQAPHGGYGGWYGGDYGGGCCGGCGGCDSCCGKCRIGLINRLKMLKCKMCAKWECRKACRSCCGSSCCGSSCCGSDSCGSHGMMHDMPVTTHGDMLPVPPAEAAPYDSNVDEDEVIEPSPHRPTSAKAQPRKQKYSMPTVTTAQKTTKLKSKKSAKRRPSED